MKAILVLTQIFLRHFIDVRVGTFFSNLCTYIYTIYLPNMATLRLLQVGFLSAETTETSVPNGDNGDKCRSTGAPCLGDRYPSPPNLASFLWT